MSHALLPTVPGADAFTIEAGRISRVGRSADLEKFPAARVIDAKGRIVLPGLIDSHIHLLTGGIAERQVRLSGAKTSTEVRLRLTAWSQAHPEAKWIIAHGLSYDFKPSLELDRPVAAYAYDGHSVWLNSKAMAILGSKTDMLSERAMVALDAVLPKHTPQELSDALLLAQQLALDAGVTVVNDFIEDIAHAEIYLEAERAGTLKLQVFVSPPIETPLAALIDLKAKLATSRHVHFGLVKGFVDGVVESNTAAFLAPYADNPKERGMTHLDRVALDRLVRPLDAAGFSVALHCIGDRAVRLALDAFDHGSLGRRHRVEHVEVLDPADVPRFAQLSVVASMQPLHAESGEGVWTKKVGRKRLTFPFSALLAARAPLAFGSDWDVASLDPLRGIAVAMRSIPVLDAIRGYTVGAAWALHAETRLGSIAPGQQAQFVMLSRKVTMSEPLSWYWGSAELTFTE